jgi:anti-anti-sigma factor
MKIELLAMQGNLARLVCEGEVAPNIAPGLQNPLEQVLGLGCYGYRALISLERTSYVNSAGIGWLVGCHKNFEKAGGKMVLHTIPPIIDHVMRLLKMHHVLNLATDEPTALEMITGAAT